MTSYITALGKYLPGEPIPSEEIESYIGSVGPNSSRLRDRVIRNSGIRTRHYAIDRSQRSTHTNTEMATAAIREALARAKVAPEDVELIATASTLSDMLAPGFASMVHGELGNPPCEIVSAQGICASGMMALKTAHLHIASGEKSGAVSCASEFASRMMKSSRFRGLSQLDEEGEVAMEVAFLRYMLSDGAGAAVIQDAPGDGLALRIEWISLRSYANRTPPCMFLGSREQDNGKAWADYEDTAAAAADGALALRQDIKLLPSLVRVGMEEYGRLYEEGRFRPESLRYVAAHYSSEIMKPAIFRELERRGLPHPPEERWFSNLPRVGNVGSASIYLILEELLAEGTLEPGDEVLCLVPESGRFVMSYMLLTAVDGTDASATGNGPG